MQHQERSTKSKNYLINVNDYTLKREIETSVYGSVYLVENNNTKKKYAVKIIKHKANENYESYKLNVNREISILIQCQHPTNLKFYGYSLTDIFGNNNVTIFMKYEENGSLFHYLQKIRGKTVYGYSNTIGQIILVGIARGMMHLHQNQVIHRDLKPGNILLDDHLHPHIIDFGQSKFNPNDRLMYQSQCFGTPIYLAPECADDDDDNQYNKKVDVYSFGIIMYEIVTKSIPYPSSVTDLNVYTFLNKIAKEDLRPTFNVPIKQSLKNLIESCWSKNPDERPTFEEIFKKLAYNSNTKLINVFSDEDTDSQTEDYYMDNVDINQVIEYANYVDNPKLIKAKNKYDNLINTIQNEYEVQIKNGFFDRLFRIFSNYSTIGKLKIPNRYLNLDYSRNWNNINPNKKNIKGGQPYYYPFGFQGFGLYVKDFDENTVVAYHGTRYGNIIPILRDGFGLPSDIGNVNDYISHMCDYFEPTGYQDAIFVTPSLKFASLYGANVILENDNKEMIDIVILQVRVKINTYQIFPKQINQKINDPHFNDDEIEWRVPDPKNVFPYRILIKRIPIDKYNQIMNQ